MINTLLGKVFGTKNEREIKRTMPNVQQITALEPEIKRLSDAELRAKTDEFRTRIQERTKDIEDDDERRRVENEVLAEILPEAFAVCARRPPRPEHAPFRCAADRRYGAASGQDRRDEDRRRQNAGRDTACVPERLAGRGVHVVTVNDYLAKRDSEWMGKIYTFLGLTVGVIVHDLDDEERRAAYAADVTYGTNNEYGFDYLRDNMKFDLGDCVQRGHHFAIVDEVDSILIDEARTPLIISGSSEQTTDKYDRVNRIIPVVGTWRGT